MINKYCWSQAGCSTASIGTKVARWRSIGQTVGMQRFSLDALARQQLKQAAESGGGHAADTVMGGHERVLRQTVIGMISGSELSEHANPGEATVHVLLGRVRLSAGDSSWEGRSGDLLIVPDARHSLVALEDSAVLLTVAKLP
jgi:quercetin dioxygenase-like cupin family protein